MCHPELDSGSTWIPAFAGMTVGEETWFFWKIIRSRHHRPAPELVCRPYGRASPL